MVRPSWFAHHGSPIMVRPSWFAHHGSPIMVRPSWFDRLDDVEALEFRMAEIEFPVVPGVGVRPAERLGSRPGLEVAAAPPDRVRRIEHVVVVRRSAQQVERHEAGYAGQVAVARGPDRFEIRLRAWRDAKAVHSDEHAGTSRLPLPWTAMAGKDFNAACHA